MTYHLRFSTFYIELKGAVGQRLFLCAGDVDEIEEFDHGTDMRNTTEKRCNIYTKNGEFVVRHTIEEVFDLIDKNADAVSEAKKKDMEDVRAAMAASVENIGKKPN